MNVFSEKQILVVGGTGFIGQHLVARLIALQAELTVISYEERFNEPQLNTKQVQLDISDKKDLSEKLQQKSFDYVFNLSGYIDHKLYSKGGRALVDVHYIGLLNLLDHLDWILLKAFVQVGSSDEYGTLPAPQIETLREAPISPYSAAKVAATQLIQMLSRSEAFPGIVLRFFLVYGPGQEGKRILPQIIKACLKNESFPASKGDQLRDFCYVDDVIDALLIAASTEAAKGELFNIASGEPVKIRSVIENIQAFTKGGQAEWGAIPYRPGENMALYADISKAKKILNWKPKFSLEEGLKKTIVSYQEIL